MGKISNTGEKKIRIGHYNVYSVNKRHLSKHENKMRRNIILDLKNVCTIPCKGVNSNNNATISKIQIFVSYSNGITVKGKLQYCYNNKFRVHLHSSILDNQSFLKSIHFNTSHENLIS